MRIVRYIHDFVANCLKDEAGWVVLFILFAIIATAAGMILLSH